jgi:hypothetical protein
MKTPPSIKVKSPRCSQGKADAVLNVSHPKEQDTKANDCVMPSDGNAQFLLSPLPDNFVADSPTSRWEIWRRQTGLRLCSTAVQTSPKTLLPKRSMAPFRVTKVDAAVQTSSENISLTLKVDAAVQTSSENIPLTLKHLQDELKAFAIAFGF